MCSEQTLDRTAREVGRLVERIWPILAGNNSGVVSAALADLVAMWLAGHFVPNDPKATKRARAAMLALLIAAVDELIEVNAKILGTKLMADKPEGRE